MASIVVQIRANLNWQYSRARGGNGAYIAICEPLKLTLQADTFSDLLEDINFSMDALLKDLLAEHELDAFLREHGWAAINQIPARSQNVRFDVPFDLVRANGQQAGVCQ